MFGLDALADHRFDQPNTSARKACAWLNGLAADEVVYFADAVHPAVKKGQSGVTPDLGAPAHQSPRRAQPTMNEVTTIGIDLAKNVFQVHGIDGSGETVTRRRLRRSQMIAFFEKLSPCCSAKTSSMPPIWARGFALISVLSKPLRRTSSAIMTTSSVTSPF